jgi:hypothetical protein
MHSFSIRGSIKNNLRTLVFILLISTSVQAQTTYTWIGGSGNWNDQSKWTPIGIPNGSDIAIMNSGDVTLSEATNVGGLQLNGGSIVGDWSLTILNDLSWTDGIFQASIDTVWVRSSATFTISGSSNKGLNRVLVNESTCSWTEGNIILGGNVPGFINSSVLDIQTDAIFGENSLGKIINNGTLKKTTGDGITTISSSFVNNGFVEIQTGTLRPTKTTTNTSTGVISGVGTFSKNSGSFINNGTFSPGLSPGVLNFTGNFTMSETAAYNIELGGTTSGTQYDRMDVSGTASLNGELNISLTNGFIPAVNDTFRILNSTGGSGIFATVNVPTDINILTSYSENGVTIKVTSVISDIENGLVLELPKGHFLKQNYPNPFNPSTNIKFSVAKTGFVRLAVYNSIGEELDVLVSGQVNAGFYEIEFDAAYLPSGIYFYRIQAGSFVETKKMVLLK